MGITSKLEHSDSIWILGGGRFGTLAAERLSPKVAPNRVWVIDHRPERLAGVPEGVETVIADAAEYLSTNLGVGEGPGWIVPAVPVHVVWEFIRKRLASDFTLEALPPDAELLQTLPNVMTGEDGAMYASIADFMCPDNCPEPADCCTHTGKPRPVDMHSAISEFAADRFVPVVVRSHQLAPGVGGYRPAAIMDALEQVRASTRPVLLATACRCHGVLHLVGKTPNS